MSALTPVATIEDLVAALGGEFHLSRTLSLVSPSAVRDWPRRGIPPALHMRLYTLARRRGFDPALAIFEMDQWLERLDAFEADIAA